MQRTRVLVLLVTVVVVGLTVATLMAAEATGEKVEGTTPCAAAARHHEAMQSKLAAMDARLDEMVAAMNDAEGDAKVEAMAGVINELVAQRATLRSVAQKAGQVDMHHLMWHLHDGHHDKGCPMAAHHEAMHPEEPEGEDTASTH